MILTITGASGVGKTTILKQLAKNLPKNEKIKIFHFDDVGVPNWGEIEDDYNWQEETTYKWLDKIIPLSIEENTNILFEGSTDIKYLIQGFEKHQFTNYKILLFDCSPETMESRLTQRGQKELYNSDMVNWLNYLRDDATKRNIDIIKTDQISMENICKYIISQLIAL